MPLYEYRCDTGHITDHLCRHAERPDGMTCPICSGFASLAISLPAIGSVSGSKNPIRAQPASRPVINEKGTGLLLIDWWCECGKKAYDVYEVRPEVAPACACGATMREVIGVPSVDWFTKLASGNPNGVWDRGAGRYFTSKGDRQRWMDANGLVDGNDVDAEATMRRGREAAAANDAACQKIVDGYDSDPGLRKARDLGLVPDWNCIRPD